LRRIEIDARWLDVCFRTEEQRKSQLCKTLCKAHAVLKAKIRKALGLDGIPTMSSRESFFSETTVRGDEGEGKGVVGRRMMRF